MRLADPPRGSLSPDERALREDACAILEAALAAADPEPLVERALRDGGVDRGPVTLLAVGKAAVPMARGAVRALGSAALRAGLVLEPDGSQAGTASLPGALAGRSGGHPLPTADGVRAAREARALVEGAGSGEPVLLLLSGGGSALLTDPEEGIGLEDLRTTTELLLRAGASIARVNAVRKHLEGLKGGGLARAVHPRPLTVLALSDVVGDRPDVIASGPASPDDSTFADALDVLRSTGVAEEVPSSVRDRLERGARGELAETPGPGDPCFQGVRYRVVGSVATAVDAATLEARRRGYGARRVGCPVEGEARGVGARLAALARRRQDRSAGGSRPRGGPWAVVGGGETTVTVRGDGRGGPNQEVALSAAPALEGTPGALVGSLGTDGVDGPTDAAGGVATAGSATRARAGGVDPHAALRANDARSPLAAAGDLVVTGPTGTNVMDVQLVLVRDALDETAGSR